MIVPPASLGFGVALLDTLTNTTRAWTQLLGGSAYQPVLRRPAVMVPPPEQLESLAASDGIVTNHALLVLLGQFAQHLGLLRLLHAVPIVQKTVDHSPQSKLIEFLVAILAGLQQLQELNDAAQPLVKDRAVQQAWGQAAFAHYSGVSRTLRAADSDTLQAVLDALAQVSRPFIERELLSLLRRGELLTVDIDLSGRPVSPTSTSYPDASFGWMDDEVAKGYQSAISSLSGAATGRVLLAAQRYEGRATSAGCLQAAVARIEQVLNLRPRRRTTLVQARLETLSQRLLEQQAVLASQQNQQAALGFTLAHYQQQPSPLSERHQRQLARLQQRLERTSERLSRLRGQVAAREAEITEVREWLAQLEAENASLPAEVPIVLRLDAGFASEANLSWLVEMGYCVLSKVHSGQTSKRLQRTVASSAVWERVGANAEALGLGAVQLGKEGYRFEVLQVRYQLPEGLRYTSLLYYGEAPPPEAQAWFHRYNARQTAEAGIKENKSVFTMQRPLVRSQIGMQLQEQFALFAANFVRWAASWAQQQLQDVPPVLAQALSEVKTLVRVVAHSRAVVVESDLGCVLVFDVHSAFAGAVLPLRGQVVYQNVLPLFSILPTTAQEVT